MIFFRLIAIMMLSALASCAQTVQEMKATGPLETATLRGDYITATECAFRSARDLNVSPWRGSIVNMQTYQSEEYGEVVSSSESGITYWFIEIRNGSANTSTAEIFVWDVPGTPIYLKRAKDSLAPCLA